MIIEVTKKSEFEDILANNNFVIVDFWAPWCGSCRMLMPVIKQIEDELPELTVAGINVDELQEISSQYDIQSIPTLVLFRDHAEVASHNGFASSQALIDWIKEN